MRALGCNAKGRHVASYMTGILKTTRHLASLPDFCLRKAKLVPTTSQIPSSSASAQTAMFLAPEGHREAQGRLSQARPPALLPAYLRLRAAGKRRHRSALPAEAPGAGRASSSGSGKSRAPREAIALPAAVAREPKPLRCPLSGRPLCATVAATNAARETSPDP